MKKKIKKHKEQKTKRISSFPILFFTIITTVIIVNLSVAKYKSITESIDSVQVAVMANDTYVQFDDEISGYPGCEPKVYAINITNKENDKICEVKQKFKIKIEREETTNLPIEIDLYKDAACTQIIDKNEDGYYEKEDYYFDAGVEQTKTFYIKIIWPEARKNATYAFEIDYFDVHVISTQID